MRRRVTGCLCLPGLVYMMAADSQSLPSPACDHGWLPHSLSDPGHLISKTRVGCFFGPSEEWRCPSHTPLKRRFTPHLLGWGPGLRTWLQEAGRGGDQKLLIKTTSRSFSTPRLVTLCHELPRWWGVVSIQMEGNASGRCWTEREKKKLSSTLLSLRSSHQEES